MKDTEVAEAPENAIRRQAEADAHATLKQAEVAAEARLRQAESDAEVMLRQAEADAETKLRQAEVDADATLRRAELPAAAMLHRATLDAEARLRQAEAPAEAMLHLAAIEAAATLRRAEAPAAAMLHQAVVEAEATLRRAEAPAESMLRQAVVDADARLRRAEAPAEAMLQQATRDADARVRRAEAPAEAMLHQAVLDADARVRRAEVPAEAMLQQATIDADARLRRAEAPAEAMLHQAAIDAEARLRRAEAPAEAILRQATVDAEATLQEAEQEQHDVFERFFALSLDMMCMSSRGYLTRVNSSFAVLGYSRDELLSRPTLDFVHPDDRAATEAAFLGLGLESPAVKYENRYRCKDGSYRWLSWASSRDVSGAVYSMARDITEAKGHHEVLVRAKEAAEHVSHELESFSYSVAHDLRAPLRSIDNFTQALLEDYLEKLDATGVKYLNFIHDASRHMAQLIDGLLGLSRVTRSVMRCQEVDLSDLAQAAITRLQASQHTRRVEVLIQDGIVGDGDRLLLAIVLDNLLGNAWKFTAKRSDARITFSTTASDAQLVYVVRDNGVGFNMAQASNLFGVFQRLHSDDEFEGTGIGLATVERIIVRHGGRVWAEGSVERGATFYFTLSKPAHLSSQRLSILSDTAR